MRSRDFRLLIAGLIVSNIGGWMQIFALGILVVQIAEREGAPELAPFYLGLMGLARAVPGMALTLVAGAVADRVDRRRLLIVTQSVMALSTAALALAAFADVVSIPIVLAASAVHSAAFAFDNPARQSLVPRLVPLPVLPSAIGMQSAAFNGASIVGPLIAGLLYIPIGIPALLAVNAASFAVIIGALVLMRPVPPVHARGASLLASVALGARYVRKNPTLIWILVVSGTVFSTVGPMGALLPALAGEALYNGMSWLSLLLTALGLGAFTGSMFVMNVGRVRRLGRMFVAGAVVNGMGLVAFSVTYEPLVSLVLAFVIGLSGTLMAGMGNNILQATTADAYRGRVMSLWGILFIGIMPIGQLLLGVLGSLLGIHTSLFVGGAVALAAGVYVGRRVPAVVNWRAPSRRRVEAVEPVLAPVAGVTTLK
ncbi:MAG TPA: MFS transporter [Candidatus Limnocylindria bacterium]|nr:MFS transporter [Candidatus Limnocylindria bacterium]